LQNYANNQIALGMAMKMARTIPFQLNHLSEFQSGLIAHRGAYMGAEQAEGERVAECLVQSLVDAVIFKSIDVTAERLVQAMSLEELNKITLWLSRRQYQQIAELLLKVLRKDSDSVTEAVKVFGEKYRSAKKLQPLLRMSYERSQANSPESGDSGRDEEDSGSEG